MDRTQLAAELAAGVAAHLAGWEGADLGTIEAEAQAVLRRAGGALLGGLAAARVAGLSIAGRNCTMG